MPYLYRHIRLDKNEPFYIGISKKDDNYTRAFENKEYQRSLFWTKVIAKTEYEVEILMESTDYEFIKQKEIEFIKLYGRKDLRTGTLVNLTDGGDGTLNTSDNSKIAIKLSNKKNKSKECISFETNKTFCSLKEACKEYNISYGGQKAAIRQKSYTALFYYKDQLFDRKNKKVKKEKILKTEEDKKSNSFYHFKDFNGNEYRGVNVSDFARKYNLSQTGLSMVVNNKRLVSQGFYSRENEDIIREKYKEIVIVDLESNKIFETSDLQTWCKENQPSLLEVSTKGNKLNPFLKKKNKLCMNRWWVTYKTEWKGYVEIDLNTMSNVKKYTLIDKEGELHTFNNIRLFCKEKSLKISTMYSMLRGDIKQAEGYKLIKKEYIFKNTNDDGTRIFII